MIETISAEELASDPGYPGMVPGHVAKTVYYAPFKKLTEADLEGFGSWNTGGPMVVHPMG